jgi:hypothetical protein
MRKVVVIVLCIVAVIGAPILWYAVNFPSYIYRYGMTIEVLVDGQVRFGQGVIQVEVDTQPTFLGSPPHVSRVRGEAIPVDLGNGRILIALLASGPLASYIDYPAALVPTLFGLPLEGHHLAKLPVLQGIRDVPPDLLPTFVTLTDPNELSTLRVIAPDEFQRVFGDNVQLRKVTIEMTKEPVATGIEKTLPMLVTQADRLRRFTSDLPARFQPHVYHFKRN